MAWFWQHLLPLTHPSTYFTGNFRYNLCFVGEEVDQQSTPFHPILILCLKDKCAIQLKYILKQPGAFGQWLHQGSYFMYQWTSLLLRCPKRQFPIIFLKDIVFYIVIRPISWLNFTLAEPPTLSQRTFTTSLTCSPMLLSLTRWSVLSSMREKPSQSSSTSTLTWWGFCHPTTTFLLFLFRVNMGWTQMLDCPSLVWTTEMSSTSCESFVTILKNLFDSILHQVGSNIRFQ